MRTAIALAVMGSLAVGATALAAAIPIYGNDMSTVGKRSQLKHLGKGQCGRSGAAKALKIRIGKGTRDCDFRTPVVGSSLEISATERLLSGTPDSIRARTFVAVGLRVGAEGQYQLAAFPQKGSFQLRRDAPPNGAETLLAHGKSPKVKGINQANKLRLQGFVSDNDDVRLVAFVNGKKVATVTEGKDAAAKLSGRSSTVTVGSSKAAKGATASFDDVKVSVPDPF